jgi:hypothetical protein
MKLTVFLRKQTALVVESLGPFLPYCDLLVIDIDEFPDLAAEHKVWVTPTVILDDGTKQQRFNHFDRQSLLKAVEDAYREQQRSRHALQDVFHPKEPDQLAA